MNILKFKQEIFQLKIVAMKSCQVLTLTANLIWIVMLIIYAIKQIQN